MKKAVSLLLALSMVFALAACGGNGGSNTPAPSQAQPSAAPSQAQPSSQPGGTDVPGPAPAAYTGPDWAAIDAMDYDSASDALYEWNLGEFNEYYQKAKLEIADLNKRAALMAQAEAKLMESGVFMPVYGNGGSYAMTRVLPRTLTTNSWGVDEYRWYTMRIANELIKSEDRVALTKLWGEAADAKAYFAAAEKFMADNGYTLNDTYNWYSSYELETWDTIASSFTSDAYFVAPCWSPLLEYDAKNVQQPALAESYEVSSDGLTYTFHLRKGVNWVDQQGRVIAPVTADDWVASAMHLADNNDGLGYLFSVSDGCGVKNYDAYCNGEISDFSQVGVKAVDQYTLQYTLEAPFSPFLTMMGYSCFAPLNRSFYKSQGGTFSAEGAEYTSGNYGTSPETIAYCGAYLVSNYTEKNVTSYKVNPEFWNKDAVNLKALNCYYNDGSDVLLSYNSAKAGIVAGTGFNPSALKLAREEKPEGSDKTYYDLYHYTTVNDATTYCGWLNLHRGTWTNYNDTSVGVSTQTPEERTRTRDAMNNQNFRLALAMAFDRGAYNATISGEELKYASLRNSYTPGTFQVLTADVTIDINGKSTTFKAGTYFGEIEQAQLDADGVPLKVWDPTADSGVGSGDGYDGWFNEANAVAFLEKAIAELAQIGVEVSASKPIHIDAPMGTYAESLVNRMQAYKQSVEKALGGRVIIDLVAFDAQTQFTYAYYRTSKGAEANYDITPCTSGWGPDYGDAQTYLDTIQPYGYMTKNIGLY